ncbi:MAG: phage major capsid protein [Candidatus Riflebacteria bacterium]|nr:phage major capsid protein [Candidatus Riflebacteria bacterium]
MANMITKSDASALIPEQVFGEIFKEAQKYSKVLQLFRRLPNMTSDKMRLKVVDSLPVTYWVNESTNNGRKETTKMAWDNVYLTAEELAVIIPIKDNVLNDADINIWEQVKPELAKAIGKKIDQAVLFGIDAPASFGAGIIPAIVSKAKAVEETGRLYSDINDVMTLVEESGYEVTGLLGGVGLKGKFRMMTDTTGQPLNTTEIGSLNRAFVDNGAWDKDIATLIAGDFNEAVYSIRQDVTFDVFREGIIQNSDGSIAYNLMQEDMSAIRVVFRFGTAIPNPVTSLDQTENRYPFSALVPEGSVSL